MEPSKRHCKSCDQPLTVQEDSENRLKCGPCRAVTRAKRLKSYRHQEELYDILTDDSLLVTDKIIAINKLCSGKDFQRSSYYYTMFARLFKVLHENRGRLPRNNIIKVKCGDYINKYKYTVDKGFEYVPEDK